MTDSFALSPNEKNALAILARHARRGPDILSAGDSLAGLGIDSLKFIVAILEIEHYFACSIFDMDTIGGLRTVGDILACVRQKTA